MSPTPLPTDKSICPVSRIMNMPSASVPVIENSTMSCVRLRGPRNALSGNAKKAAIATNASGIARDLVTERIAQGSIPMPHRCRQQLLLRVFPARELPTDPALCEHDDAIAQPHQFRQLA